MKNILLISLKFLSVLLALYLSTLVLSKNIKPAAGSDISYTSTQEYSGSKGLPFPYGYSRDVNGGYNYNLIIFTIDYLFWIGFFMITDEFIIKGKFVLGKWRFKMLLNNNILYLIFSFIVYFIQLFIRRTY